MTPRQAEILQAIVETYAQTAEPVGSLVLSRSFGFSPATIRTEMAALEQQGYIRHPHTSAGRIPTDKGYRYYVNSLEQSSNQGRVSQALARRIQSAGQIDAAIKQAAESLSEVTHNLGIATMSQGMYFTGLASLFGQPEYSIQRHATETARLLDNLSQWLAEASPTDRVSVFIGNENPIGKSSGSSLILARYHSPFSDRSYIGVLGPTRQNYRQAMGLVEYAGQLLEESING